MFSYEVIFAHILGEMTEDWKCPNAGQLGLHNASDRAIFNDVYGGIGYDKDLDEGDWITIHKNAVYVIQEEFGNNDGFFWEPIILGGPHSTMHYLHGVELIKRINLVTDIPEPDTECIEGDTMELTTEEYNIVFVGGLEKKKKKKKKKTKEKDLSQQELNRGGEGSVRLTSPLSSAPPSVRGSAGGGGGSGSGARSGGDPGDSPRSSQQGQGSPGGDLGGGRGELDDENAGDNRDDMDVNAGDAAGKRSNKHLSENPSEEGEERNANAKRQRTSGGDLVPAGKAEALKVLEKDYKKDLELMNLQTLTDPIGVVKMLWIYKDPFPGYFFEWKWHKNMKEDGIDQHIEVLNSMKDWVAEHSKLGMDEKDVLLKAMKTDIDLLIMTGTEIVSKLQEKGNLNGGRDGVGSSMIDVRECSETSLSKWGVAPFVEEERSQVVKFVQDLSGDVLKHMKKLSDNMQTGGNVNLKLYFELLKYLEAVMKKHVVQFKEKVVQL
ncbi:hypothetical protein M422DRAFT_263107 [Sphaerobolus stellatus SS14]|uniref:Uncharacterized protein n=1 Tax=Sphaerobolus stellatus (strain SS14) TaxID=990650 RepID=A0A0C9VBN5_SPHS4|nr:hypothetical protein M422DRAFT_263107 [Sphaerobolus stellatus SS14]